MNLLTEELKIYRLEQLLNRAEKLNTNCLDNMNRLNQMMLELKGIVAMVRPQVKKSGWYGEELNADPINESGIKYIEGKRESLKSMKQSEIEN